MTKAEKAELLRRAVSKLDEAASLLSFKMAGGACYVNRCPKSQTLIHVEIEGAEAA